MTDINKVTCGVSTTSQLFNTVNGLVDAVSPSSNNSVAVKVSGTDVYVGYKLDKLNDVFWHFRPEGVNQQFATTRAYKLSNATDKPVLTHDFTAAEASPWVGTVTTDWTGPYMITTQGSNATTFSGGHHDKSGGTDINGTPSATSDGFKVIINNSEVTDGEYYCDEVVMTTTNLVQGDVSLDTTNRMKQYCKYTVNKLGIHTRIESTALVDLRITTFYGIQTHAGGSDYGDIRFIGDQTATGLTTASTSTANSGLDVYNPVRVVSHYKNDGYTLNSFVCNTGIGDLRLKGGSNGFVNRSNSKTYFRSCVSGLNMDAGETVVLEGGWSVHKTLTIADGEIGSSGTAPKGISYYPTPNGVDFALDFYGASGNSSMRFKALPIERAQVFNVISGAEILCNSAISTDFAARIIGGSLGENGYAILECRGK